MKFAAGWSARLLDGLLAEEMCRLRWRARCTASFLAATCSTGPTPRATWIRYYFEGLIDQRVAAHYFEEFHNRREGDVMPTSVRAVTGAR